MLIFKYDAKIDMSPMVVLAPATLTWLGLVFTQIRSWITVWKTYKKVIDLHNTDITYMSELKEANRNLQPTGLAPSGS
jgi:hypothetical protein